MFNVFEPLNKDQFKYRPLAYSLKYGLYRHFYCILLQYIRKTWYKTLEYLHFMALFRPSAKYLKRIDRQYGLLQSVNVKSDKTNKYSDDRKKRLHRYTIFQLQRVGCF